MNEKLSSLRKLLADRSTSGLKEDTEEEGTEKASRIHKQTQFVLATTRGMSVIIPSIIPLSITIVENFGEKKFVRLQNKSHESLAPRAKIQKFE